MPYFHATAVFEARAASPEETDRIVTALFKTIRHPRVRYYEHDTSGGIRATHPPDSLFFTVIADFDVEAGNEESATDLVEEVLDFLSNESVHYFTHGITPGEQRVRPEPRAQQKTERPPAREVQAEQGDREEREEENAAPVVAGEDGEDHGKQKRCARTNQRKLSLPRCKKNEPDFCLDGSSIRPEISPEISEEENAAVEERIQEPAPPPPASAPVEAALNLPPPRSSTAMHVTLTVTLHASELPLQTNGSTLPEREELLGLAMAEARRQHPELPVAVTPECTVASLPWGDTLLYAYLALRRSCSFIYRDSLGIDPSLHIDKAWGAGVVFFLHCC